MLVPWRVALQNIWTPPSLRQKSFGDVPSLQTEDGRLAGRLSNLIWSAIVESTTDVVTTVTKLHQKNRTQKCHPIFLPVES